MHLRKARFLAVMLLAALFYSACSDGGNDFFNVQALTVTPDVVSLRQGETEQLVAIASIFASGSQDATGAAAWESSNPSVATVSDTGLVTAVGPGNATITATLNGREDNAQITVDTVQTGLTLTPNDRFVLVGTTLQLSATGQFDNGTTADVNSSVSFSSASSSIASVSDSGLVSGVAVGQTTITATSSNGQTASVTVNVFQANVFTAGGSSPAAVQGTVDAFRAELGALNPNTAQQFPSGRREINWDGVPPELTNTDAFPNNFFNTTSPRGVIFTSDGTGFRVSDNAFIDVNPTYATQFQAFSAPKIFAPRGAHNFETQFFLPGSITPAFSNGFGAIFCDPDNQVSSIRYVLSDGSVFVRDVPDVPGSLGLSFLGVAFQGATCSRVTLICGQATIAGANNDVTNGGTDDIVVVDDFIYGEPQPAP